jgi:hypothetical protein
MKTVCLIQGNTQLVPPEREQVAGELRRLHDEEHNDLYSPTNVIRVIKSIKMRWTGHVARTGKRRGAYGILVEIPEGRRPLRRARCRQEDNVKMDL